MPKSDLSACPYCGYKPAVLFSSTNGWVVMCLRYNCPHPPRVMEEPKSSRGDVVVAWNEQVSKEIP